MIYTEKISYKKNKFTYVSKFTKYTSILLKYIYTCILFTKYIYTCISLYLLVAFILVDATVLFLVPSSIFCSIAA